MHFYLYVFGRSRIIIVRSGLKWYVTTRKSSIPTRQRESCTQVELSITRKR
ncbi:hypothetical protein Hanom_Chr05g00433631 [Helianthus anomalus]